MQMIDMGKKRKKEWAKGKLFLPGEHFTIHCFFFITLKSYKLTVLTKRCQ